MFVLYFLIGLFATTLGAITGIGGGVIIKPVLDAIGTYDVGTISALSSATVFAMAVVSLLRNSQSRQDFQLKTTFLLALGSIVGGTGGKAIFNELLSRIGNTDGVTLVQACLLVFLLILILINRVKDFPSYQLRRPVIIFSVGLILGGFSAFLGIGGGPLNVAVLIFVFSMGIKAAAIHSILIIFFSQLATLITISFTTGFGVLDMSMLGYMIAGGVIGGFIGSSLSKKIESGYVDLLFKLALVGIILINLSTIMRIVIS
ncbi:sulfite exporter TauE/SafE family protein [Halobacillus fulvus]|nr:sulfite exporter TauE/SafE family protein [Halobacillus fulvus]